ncbi:methionine--tRNA ligase [Candidatus Peregrinibacteria bacterium CG08_land_8_20_14_0_20_41_10]|nr:MAG: methionine--tRNA ligase [Candidatus Peregrinibacteria bacterium CG08_land_8_20_14_0_20_41_10]
MSKFYLTTSAPYVNAKPHLGHFMEFVEADVIARYHRIKGDEVCFLSSTDENGSKMYHTAQKLGGNPQQICDENSAYFRETKDALDISMDKTIRTTDPRHQQAVQKLWLKFVEKGDIEKSKYEGLYCEGCEAFITEKDLVDGKCPEHQREPQFISEENYFFKLSRYSEQLQKLIQNDTIQIIPAFRKNEILNVIKSGLQDVCFSRPKASLPWGVDVPNDPDYVIYVWCDALINYLSGIGYGWDETEFQKWWPADLHVIGKGISRFHALVWPAMLLSADLPLFKQLFVHGYVTLDGQKMSKSLGNVVDPYELLKKYGSDATRFYLTFETPLGEDIDFTWDRMDKLYHSELVNNLGNFFNRVLSISEKYYGENIPEFNSQTTDPSIQKLVAGVWDKWEKYLEAYDFKRALEAAWELLNFSNKYINEKKPWGANREAQADLPGVVYNLLELARFIVILIRPFLPRTYDKVDKQIPIDLSVGYNELKKWGGLKSGRKIKRGEFLFEKKSQVGGK